MAKYNLPNDSNTINAYNRYVYLFTKPNRIADENTELAALQTQLKDYLITADDWNGLSLTIPDGSVTPAKLSTDTQAEIDTKAPIANPTFTGTVTLPGDPTTALQAATKQYADSVGTATRNYSNGDLNALFETGFYDGWNMLNKPYGSGDWVYVVVIKHTGWTPTAVWVAQTVYDFYSNAVWTRRSTGGTGSWTAWSAIAPNVTGVYTGNGAASRDIALPFTPSAVLLNDSTGYMGINYSGGLALNGYPVNTGIDTVLQIGTNKFTVYSNSSSNIHANDNGRTYQYIAFP